MDPNPDYDVSDELEYGINWFAWILRGAYPPPAYPRSSRGSGDDMTQTSDVQPAARTFYLERKPCMATAAGGPLLTLAAQTALREARAGSATESKSAPDFRYALSC
jgi:hypothetical protein